MNVTQHAEEHPAEPDHTARQGPDEATVQHLLHDGPHGPQGRVAMAAAGIDVDRRFPVDATDDADDDTADELDEPAEAAPAASPRGHQQGQK